MGRCGEGEGGEKERGGTCSAGIGDQEENRGATAGQERG